MPFLATNDVIEALRCRLASLMIADGSGRPLFQTVGIFGAGGLQRAMQATFATESRVCFIVPGPEDHSNILRSTEIFSQRQTGLSLLIADRVANADTLEAVMGGNASVGILRMKDLVIDNFFNVPFEIGIESLAFVPTHGVALVIEPQAASANNLGREVWQQDVIAYAGSDIQRVP